MAELYLNMWYKYRGHVRNRLFIHNKTKGTADMLSRKSFFMLMTVGFALSVFATDVLGDNLIKYHENKDGTVSYYDNNSVNRKSGIVKVWTEIRVNKKNGDESILVELCKKFVDLNSINDCKKLSYVKVLYDINCKEDKYRFLSFVLYDENGKVLYSSSQSYEWDSIIPDTNIDELKNHVCK